MEHSKIIKFLVSNKTAIVFYLLYMIYYCTFLFRRTVPSNDDNALLTKTMFLIAISQAVPFMILSIISIYNPDSKLIVFLNKISNIKLITILGYPILFVMAIMPLFGHINGIWWTWTSMGLALAIILFTINIISNKVKPFDAICIGISISAIWQGLWELPYQFGLKLIYDAPFLTNEILRQNLIYEVAVELPLIIGGIFIFCMLNKYKVFNINRWTALFITLYLLGLIMWYAQGFWLDITYNWVEGHWQATEHWDRLSMFTYKSTKITLALTLISMIFPKRIKSEVKNKYKEIYEQEKGKFNIADR